MDIIHDFLIVIFGDQWSHLRSGIGQVTMLIFLTFFQTGHELFRLILNKYPYHWNRLLLDIEVTNIEAETALFKSASERLSVVPALALR